MTTRSGAGRILAGVTGSTRRTIRKSVLLARRWMSERLIRFGSRWRRPSMVALGLRLGTRARSHHAGWRNSGRVRPLEILALKNSGLVSDLDAAFARADDVRLSFIPGGLWRDIAREFLSPPLGDFDQAPHRLRHPDEHKRLVDFLTVVCARFCAHRPFDVVIAGNFTHWANHDLGLALRAIGMPFLVLHKEGLVSAWPSVAAEYEATVSEGVGATTADAVLVHSEDTARLLTTCGIAPAERIHVVGTIRLDACHAHRLRDAGTACGRWDRITFFTFWPHIGIHLDDVHADRNSSADRGDWAETLREVLGVAATLAQERPGLEVVVKSKASVSRLPSVAPLLAALAESAPTNLRIISKNEGQDLILCSDAIVGLNSTVLLEAIAAGVPAIVPSFGRSGATWMAECLLDLDGAAQAPESPEELLRILRSICDTTLATRDGALRTAQSLALARYSGNADGRAAGRLRERIEASIRPRS